MFSSWINRAIAALLAAFVCIWGYSVGIRVAEATCATPQCDEVMCEVEIVGFNPLRVECEKHSDLQAHDIRMSRTALGGTVVYHRIATNPSWYNCDSGCSVVCPGFWVVQRTFGGVPGTNCGQASTPNQAFCANLAGFGVTGSWNVGLDDEGNPPD